MRRLGLGLGFQGGRGISAAFSVSIGAGPFETGATLTATVNGLQGGETVTYQWQDDGVNISGATASSYTAAIGTDGVADASSIRCVATVDGDDFNSNSRQIRYAGGVAPSVADGQAWTVDDTSVNIDGSASGANLTFSYALSGSTAGVTINSSTGAITGTPSGVGSGTATITATDQYGRQLTDTFTWSAALRTQATGGADLDLSFEEDSAIASTNLIQNWTVNGNTLTFVSVSPSLPAGLSINSSGVLTGTPVTITADATYTLTMQDEYSRQTQDTFTLEITAVSSDTITLDTLTYTRGAAGVAPTLDSETSTTGTTTANYTLFWASRSTGTPLSKTNIENGTGDALDNGSFTAATLGALTGSMDLSQSLSSGAIDAFIRDSSGSPIESDVVSVTGVTYDAVAPAFTSATIENASPSTLTLVVDKDSYVATGETLAIGDFTFAGTLASKLTGASVVRTNATTYTFTLTSAAVNGETGTIALSAGTLVGIDAEQASFTAQSITNNVSAASATISSIVTAASGDRTWARTSDTSNMYSDAPYGTTTPVTVDGQDVGSITATAGTINGDTISNGDRVQYDATTGLLENTVGNDRAMRFTESVGWTSDMYVAFIFKPADLTSTFRLLSGTGGGFIGLGANGATSGDPDDSAGSPTIVVDGVTQSWANRGDPFTALCSDLDAKVVEIVGADLTTAGWNTLAFPGFGHSEPHLNGEYVILSASPSASDQTAIRNELAGYRDTINGV